MRRAYSYIRFSSPEQAKGDSLRRQLALTDALVKKHGWVLDDSLHLRDLAVSAYRGTNVTEGAFAGFLAAIEANKVPKGSVLIVESLDRITRQEPFDSLPLVMGILKKGILIATVSPERLYEKSPGNNAQMVAMELLFILSRAHEESSTKSDRVRSSWDQRRRHAAAEPMTGRCPEWLKLTDDGFVELPEAADAVRLIYKLSLEGMGIRRITQSLTERGVKPFGRSARWNMSYVKKLLGFRAVIGEHQPHVIKDGKRVPVGEPLSGYYPAIVSEADYYSVQKSLGVRKNRGGRVGKEEANLLTGLTYHAGDKTTMVLKRPTAGEDKYLYLTSSAYLHGKQSIGPAGFPYHPLEGAVIRTVCELKPSVFTDEGLSRGEVSEKKEVLEGELTVLKGKIEKVLVQTEKAEDPEPYFEMLNRFQKQKREKEAALEELKVNEAVDQKTALQETQTLVGMMATASGEELARLRRRIKAQLRNLVKEVWVLIERHGRVRVAQVQVYLQSGVVRPVTVFHPDNLPVPTTFEPFVGDLRQYEPSSQAATE